LVSLFWTLLLLLLLLFVFGITCMQLLADASRHTPELLAEGTPAYEHFGSVERSMFVLYQSITGGVNWKDPLEPLVVVVSPYMKFLFASFIAIAVFAVLNVITGVCVESALAKARDESNASVLNCLRDAVHSMVDEGSDQLTWARFKRHLDTTYMQGYFRSVDLHPSEAEGLFRLLDPDETGVINAEDFVMGCLRLHGTAKAIDLTALMGEVRWLRRRWDAQAQLLERTLLGCGCRSFKQLSSSPQWSPQGFEVPVHFPAGQDVKAEF